MFGHTSATQPHTGPAWLILACRCKGLPLSLWDNKIMTDSIKTSLSLTKLSPRVRKDIDARICTVSNLWGEQKERYTKPSHQRSAMTKTKTKWIVRCVPLADYPELGDIPRQIDADLNIPNSITGHNLEHGTSVFAAGVASLETLRIWMAQSGLPRAELDLLTTADVSLRGTTITYLKVFADRTEGDAFVDAIRITGKVLGISTSEDSTNVTVYLFGRDYVVKIYIKTDLSHCKFPDGAPVAGLIDRTSCIVRIEVKLGLRFLRDRYKDQKWNLVALDSWRDAYAQGVYEQIFNDTVRKLLRLDERLRHKEPREEVYARLTPTEARLLRGYIAGRDPRKFSSVVGSSSPLKRLSDLRLRILEVANTDIDIPWVEHVKLRCFELDDQLYYPDDYHPAADHSPWCFCKANWSKLLAAMRAKYEAALAAASRLALGTADVAQIGL